MVPNAWPFLTIIPIGKSFGTSGGQFHSIALLGEVLSSLQDIKDERNLVLMHELGSLIAKELREQPSAYLFERLGERYQQLFIDEFQDTSLEQWNNLQPFVEEIISSGGQVLLVGDAKQAIYRWRGGDIGQFVDLYQKGKKQEPGFALKELQTNYRSLPAVVDFNRDFFTFCAEKLGANQRYRDLYAASGQDAFHKAPEGRVEIRRFEAEKAAEYNEQQDEDLIALIKELIGEKGYKAGEIALLYRSKKGGDTFDPQASFGKHPSGLCARRRTRTFSRGRSFGRSASANGGSPKHPGPTRPGPIPEDRWATGCGR